MLEALFKEHGDEFLGAMTGAGGLDAGEAKSLLPPALSGIGDAISGGGLDLGSLLSSFAGGGDGGVSELLGKLDVASIASSAGLDEGKAQSGLASLVPAVMALLNNKSDGAGGVEGLLGMLGGGGGDASSAMGALGGIAGKLFGK